MELRPDPSALFFIFIFYILYLLVSKQHGKTTLVVSVWKIFVSEYNFTYKNGRNEEEEPLIKKRRLDGVMFACFVHVLRDKLGKINHSLSFQTVRFLEAVDIFVSQSSINKTLCETHC